MKKFLKTWICILVIFSSYGKDDPRYPVSAIPENMKDGMYAVIREQEMTFEINSISSSTTYYRVAITILSASAKRYAFEVIEYDKFSSIKSFKGTAYDATGSVIKKLKQNEIYDQSAYDEFSLYSDSRLKRADLSQGSYPYTVEFEYVIEEKRLYGLPRFYLYNDERVSIQKSTYALIYPAELKPRYKLFKIAEPRKKMHGNKEVLEWSFENIKPEKYEKFGPDRQRVIPNILAAPSRFEYDGYAGDMSTWEGFGTWKAMLLKDRDILPEKTKQRVRELTDGLTTTEEKTKILYEYLQGKTRYVSIQLGIGGLQPFDASIVDQNGYGDCKALSNYMIALLKEAGVKGYYTSIMAGDYAPEVDIAFPSHQSNHIVVSVPNGADTLWLECTNQTTPFDYQGRWTGNRKALMITEAGGRLVNTHSYPAEQNVQSRSADVFMQPTGDATAKVRTTFQGLQYENDNLNQILNYHPNEQKKWLQENIQIPSFDIASFKMMNNKNKIPSAVVDVDLILRRFATVSGKRLFLNPNLMNRWNVVLENLESRRTSIVLRVPFIDLDTISFHLPEDIYPEFLPEPVVLKSRFGEYECKYQIDQGKLLYIRRLKMIRGEFPPESYKELCDFYRNISKADNTKIVFMSKT